MPAFVSVQCNPYNFPFGFCSIKIIIIYFWHYYISACASLPVLTGPKLRWLWLVLHKPKHEALSVFTREQMLMERTFWLSVNECSAKFAPILSKVSVGWGVVKGDFWKWSSGVATELVSKEEDSQLVWISGALWDAMRSCRFMRISLKPPDQRHSAQHDILHRLALLFFLS